MKGCERKPFGRQVMLTISIDAWYDDTLKEQNICNCRAPLFSWEESLSTCSSRPSTTSPPQAGTMEMCECSELVWGKSYILEIFVWAGIHVDTLWRQLEPQVVLRVCQLLDHRLWRSYPIRWGNCGGSVTYPIEILIKNAVCIILRTLTQPQPMTQARSWRTYWWRFPPQSFWQPSSLELSLSSHEVIHRRSGPKPFL